MVRPYNAFEEPFKAAHRWGTLPLRPLGDLTRKASDALTDVQPMVSQVGDKVVDAFSPAIETGATALLKGTGDALKASAPGWAAALGGVGGSAGSEIGGLLGSILPGGGTAAGAAAGASIGTALGSGIGEFGATGAGLAADALSTATPALSKMAPAALKAGGRLAYKGFNDLVSDSASSMGSYDDNPATSRGLRALKEAQNPFSMKGLLARGPSDWAKEAGNVPELIDATMGAASTPSMSAPPLPMDGRGPAGDALKRSAPAVMAPPKPQTVGPPGPQFNGDASMMGPRTNSDRSGSDYGYSKPDGSVGFSDGPMSMPGQKVAGGRRPLTDLLGASETPWRKRGHLQEQR